MNMYQKIDLYRRVSKDSWLPKSILRLILAWSSVIAIYLVWTVVLVVEKNLSEEELAGIKTHNKVLVKRIDELSKAGKDIRLIKSEQKLTSLRTLYVEKQRFVQHLQDPKLSNLDGFSNVLSGLAKQHRAGVSLNKIEITESGSVFSMAGTVDNPVDVPAYVVRLGNEDVFDNMVFEKLRILESVVGEALRFEIRSSSKSPSRASINPAVSTSISTANGERS